MLSASPEPQARLCEGGRTSQEDTGQREGGECYEQRVSATTPFTHGCSGTAGCRVGKHAVHQTNQKKSKRLKGRLEAAYLPSPGATAAPLSLSSARSLSLPLPLSLLMEAPT